MGAISSVPTSGRKLAFVRACATTSPLSTLFAELRSLRPPCDVAQLAQLAGVATQRCKELGVRELALLCWRFENLQWHSHDLCKALAPCISPGIVGELSHPEWLAVLRYFVGSNYHHPQFCKEVAEFLMVAHQAKKLQLEHIEALVVSLAHFGHLNGPLGDRIAGLLMPLPPNADHDVLLRIAAALAAAGVHQPSFYRQVLNHTPRITRPSDNSLWRVNLLLLVASSDEMDPSLVLKLVRGIHPETVQRAVPARVLPTMVEHLHRAALRQEAILLDARPLVGALAQVSVGFVDQLEVRSLSTIALGLGFFGIQSWRISDALWSHSVADQKSWQAAVQGRNSIMFRSFVHLAWGCCVARVALSNDDLCIPAFDVSKLLALLTAAAPTQPKVRIVGQHLRQIALCVTHMSGIHLDGYMRDAVARWLKHVQPCSTDSHERQVQEHILSTWQEHLHLKGLRYRREYRAPGLLQILPTAAQVGLSPLNVMIWAKHPMLLSAAREDPMACDGGASEQSCCLNGFQAIERRVGRPSILHLVALDVSTDQAKADLDCVLIANGFLDS